MRHFTRIMEIKPPELNPLMQCKRVIEVLGDRSGGATVEVGGMELGEVVVAIKIGPLDHHLSPRAERERKQTSSWTTHGSASRISSGPFQITHDAPWINCISRRLLIPHISLSVDPPVLCYRYRKTPDHA